MAPSFEADLVETKERVKLVLFLLSSAADAVRDMRLSCCAATLLGPWGTWGVRFHGSRGTTSA